MAKKRRSKARRGLRLQSIDLKKKLATMSDNQLKATLKKASRKRIAIIVLNAPFKLGAAEAAS